MSIFGEFRVPTETFALSDALERMPEVEIETERIVATEELLTPYFWVSGGNIDEFESALEDDPSVVNIRRVDDYDRASLFHADWTEHVEGILYAYGEVDATILEACGHNEEWRLAMRFDNHERLDQFRSFCNEQQIPFRLTQLHEVTRTRTGSQYGLTPKQQQALVTAWEFGYFSDSDVTLADVADELEITPQSLSELLHRGYHSLISHTLIVTSP